MRTDYWSGLAFGLLIAWALYLIADARGLIG